MNIRDSFNDPRHRRSEELSFLAERAERTGDLAGALAQYADAARLEEENALAVPGDVPKIRELFAVSAVSLWLRAERWSEAARAGCGFLAQPDMLTPDGVRALQKLVDRAWRTAEVEQALGTGGTFVPVEAVLSGGLVRQGLAPSTVVTERRDVFAPLLVRAAEWRSRKKYRRAGPSPLANSYEILEAPAVAGSYGLRLYVGASAQQTLDGAAATPRDVVEHFLGLAEAVATGPEALREMVGDDAYTKAFLRSFRDLAPDGRAVGEVALGAMTRGRIDHVATLTPETRERLTVSLRRRAQEKPVSLDGVLKSVNLRGDEPKIGVETVDGVHVFRIAKGEHDDTIGPKLNRSVRIMGMRRVNEDGEAAEWAEDVLLLEEATRVTNL
jgi:hypothetical protein